MQRCSLGLSFFVLDSTAFHLILSSPSNSHGLFVTFSFQIVSSLPDAGANAELAKLSNLRSLRELHLLMFGMETVNLNDIYVFIKTCHCPQLERLFVQVITCYALAKCITC